MRKISLSDDRDYHLLGGKIAGLKRLTCQAKIGSEEGFLDEWLESFIISELIHFRKSACYLVYDLSATDKICLVAESFFQNLLL